MRSRPGSVVNRFLAIRSLEMVKWKHTISTPLFIAEASSNHGRDLARAKAFRGCGGGCGLRRGQIPAFQDRPHVRAGDPGAKPQAPGPRANGNCRFPIWRRWPNTVRPGKSSFPARPSIWKRWPSWRPSSISTRSRPMNCWSRDLAEGLRPHRQAGGAVHRHGHAWRKFMTAAALPAGCGRARRHAAALRFGLSHPGRGSQSFRHRHHPRRHRPARRLVRPHAPARGDRTRGASLGRAGGRIPSRSRRQGRGICRRPLLAAGRNRAGHRAHPRKPRRRRQPASRVRSRPKFPTANGAPIPATACGR